MKRLTLFIIGLIVVELVNAQITFQKTFKTTDYGHWVKQTLDGGYIITGGWANIFLIKTDANGDTAWTKKFDLLVSAGPENSSSVELTADSGYIVVGRILAPGNNNFDVFIIKTDSSGDTLWTKTYGDLSGDGGESVHQTIDGGYIISGYTRSSSGGNYSDVYLIKTDAVGNISWTKTYGGTTNQGGLSVQQTTDYGYIITGYCCGAWGDVYLVKTDTSGNLLWSKTYHGSMYESGAFVQQTTDGGYIIAGSTYSFGAGNSDIYLVKTDSIGDTLWTKTYGWADDDLGYQVQQTTDGGYVVTGSTYISNIDSTYGLLIKTDVLGNTLWTKSFRSGNFYHGSVQQTTDGGYIITGAAADSFTFDPIVYLVKTDSKGESGCQQWNTSPIIGSAPFLVSTHATLVSSKSSLTNNVFIIGSLNIIPETLCSTVGINELLTDKSFLIFPNPSSGNFNISFEGTIMKGNVEILNTMGGKVFTESIFNESTKEIALKNISSGIYFVKVFDGEKTYCKKLIVQ